MSLKGDKYETTEEVKFRLESSVVLYDGKPVFINQVSLPEAEDRKEIARVVFQDLPLVPGGKQTRKYLSSRNFDLAPFRMGYFNMGGEAVFASRVPVRQNKQGLTANTTKYTDVRGKPADKPFARVVASQGFVDMIEGKYPSFKDVGDMLDGKTTSVAVSRSFAFLIDAELEALILFHKGLKCAFANMGDKGLKVPKKFHFLREEMEEHRIPIL